MSIGRGIRRGRLTLHGRMGLRTLVDSTFSSCGPRTIQIIKNVNIFHFFGSVHLLLRVDHPRYLSALRKGMFFRSYFDPCQKCTQPPHHRLKRRASTNTSHRNLSPWTSRLWWTARLEAKAGPSDLAGKCWMMTIGACNYGNNCLFKRSKRLDSSKCDARKDYECRNVFHAKCVWIVEGSAVVNSSSDVKLGVRIVSNWVRDRTTFTKRFLIGRQGRRLGFCEHAPIGRVVFLWKFENFRSCRWAWYVHLWRPPNTPWIKKSCPYTP